MYFSEYEELQQITSSNQRRDERLARVRGKDFSVKLEQMEVSTREGDRGSMSCLIHRVSVCSRGGRWWRGRRNCRWPDST